MANMIYPMGSIGSANQLGLSFAAFFDDFTHSSISTTEGAAVWFNNASTGGTITFATDAGNTGEVTLVTGTNNTDAAAIFASNEAWRLTLGKRLTFETRMKISTVDSTSDHDMLVGLSVIVAEFPESLPDDFVGFSKTADADLEIQTRDGGTGAAEDTGVDLAADTYTVLGFVWDGVSTIRFFKDGVKVGEKDTTNDNIPLDENLTIGFGIENDGTTAGTMTVDYVAVFAQR